MKYLLLKKQCVLSNKAVIIVAGGSGSRMNSVLAKQYLCLANKPILMHTIERFYAYNSTLKLVVVLPKEDHEFWNNLCYEYNFNIPHDLASGGATRFDSVKNGLDKLTGQEWVAVHDGVRPFVAHDVLDRCFSKVQDVNAVIPVISVFDTLRSISRNETVNRSDYCLVQTPQVFSTSLLLKAYNQPYNSLFTDDASVVEAFGYAVTLVDGNRENIKITTPFDLKLGEVLLHD